MFKSSSRVGRQAAALCLLALMTPAAASALEDDGCMPDSRVVGVARDWLNRTAVAGLELADVAAARCFQKAFIEQITPQVGAPIGYKVGLFSAAGQARFETDRPVLGQLFENMLIPPGQAVRADYGVAPAWESDLLLVVGDASINTARTREDIYRSLRALRPFIELGNGNFAPGVKLTALQLQALGVGARLGVAGPEVPLDQTPQGFQALADLAVEASLTRAGVETVDRARAAESLGDPMEIVRFARDAVVDGGGALKPGDVISLGTFTPSKAPQPGDVVAVRYTVGSRTESVSVTFE